MTDMMRALNWRQLLLGLSPELTVSHCADFWGRSQYQLCKIDIYIYIHCVKTPVPLNPKWRPKTLEEVENFKCAHCREQAFNIYNCLGCHQKNFTNAFDAVAIKAHVKNCNKNKLLCLECLEQGRTIRDIKLYSCHPCNRELGRAKFCTGDMNRFQQGRLRVLRCTKCKLSGTMSTQIRSCRRCRMNVANTLVANRS